MACFTGNFAEGAPLDEVIQQKKEQCSNMVPSPSDPIPLGLPVLLKSNASKTAKP